MQNKFSKWRQCWHPVWTLSLAAFKNFSLKNNTMNLRSITASLLISVFLFSCVSSKKYKQAQTDYANLQVKQSQLEGDLSNCFNTVVLFSFRKSICLFMSAMRLLRFALSFSSSDFCLARLAFSVLQLLRSPSSCDCFTWRFA